MSEESRSNILNFFSEFVSNNADRKNFIIYFTVILILSVISFSYYIQNNNCFLYNDPRRIISGLFFVLLSLIIGLIATFYGVIETINEVNTDGITTRKGAWLYVFWVILQIVLIWIFTLVVFGAPISLVSMNENTFNIGHPRYKAISASLSFLLIIISISMIDNNIVL